MEKTKFEEGLRQKLEAFEPSGYSSDWEGIKNKLPKQGKPAWFKAVVITGAVAVLTGIIILCLPDKPTDIESDQTGTPSQNEQIVNSPEDDHDTNTEDISQPEQDHKDNTADKSESEPVSEKNKQDKVSTPEPSNSSSENFCDKSDKNNSDNNIAEDNTTKAASDTIAESTEKDQKQETNTDIKPQIVSNQDNTCIPVKVEFKTNVDTEKYDLKWYFGDGTTSQEINPVHTYKQTGEYQATLHLKPYDDNKKSQRLNSETITCHGIKKPKIYFDKTKNLFTFSTVENGDISYHWKIDGKQFNTAVVDYEFREDGNYPVKLKLTDGHGCTKETIKKLDVEIEHHYYVPNAINLSSNGVNANFKPVGEDLQSMEYRMMIYDKNGHLVFETDNINKPWTGINQQTNKPAERGVYLWKITTKDKYGNTRHKQGQVTLFRN